MNEKNFKLFSVFIVKGKKGNLGIIIEIIKYEFIIVIGFDDVIVFIEI